MKLTPHDVSVAYYASIMIDAFHACSAQNYAKHNMHKPAVQGEDTGTQRE